MANRLRPRDARPGHRKLGPAPSDREAPGPTGGVPDLGSNVYRCLLASVVGGGNRYSLGYSVLAWAGPGLVGPPSDP
jgi:hypothetical protein